MSLDDPNVIAGIATDGTPFFDDPNQAHNQARSTATTTSGSTTTTSDVNTPMPLKRGSGLLLHEESHHQKFPISGAAGAVGVAREIGSTPSREKDSKELKEFWKQYMRIPLSGSEMLPSMPGSEGVTPSGGNGSKVTNTSGPGPGPGYRRPRVASLPAVKTPIAESTKDHLDAAVYLNNAQHPSDSTLNAGTGDCRLAAGTAYLGKASSPETGMDMDNPEDLRSYEAAVMARKAPTMLSLKRPMKGRGRAVGGTTKGKLRDEGSASATSASSENNSPRAMVSGDIMDCSSSSSLANAFGTGRLPVSSHSRDQMVLSAPGTLPIAGGRVKKEEKSSSPLLSSPTSSCDENKSDLGSMEGPSPLMINSSGRNNMPVERPSFKRLPSQTLGPDNSKRTFYGFGGEVEDRVVSGWGAIGGNDGDDRRDVLGGGRGGGSSAERRMRKRRMSEPSTGLTGGHGGFDREDHLKNSSRVDVSAVQNVDELWYY